MDVRLCRVLLFVILPFLLFETAVGQQSKIQSFVMGPLELITDWKTFGQQLEILKESGVDGITTDIVWSIVEPQEGNFRWDYYRQYAAKVKEAGLLWIPIIGFHKIGETIGDTVEFPLPDWVWQKFKDMKFVSSDGYESQEYISYWTEEAYSLYAQVMKSFAQNFGDYIGVIGKIYVSLGPAGELRYPSYSSRAGWKYPEIGSIQAYSERAKEDFRYYLQKKYRDVIHLNRIWNLKFESFEEESIGPPTDGIEFFKNGSKTAYGRDFLIWYQGTLEEHFDRMLKLAKRELQSFKVPFGGKIAGIHWRMGDPRYPHSAEYAAGYFNYDSLVKGFAKNGAELTFTSIELSDNDTYPFFSMPRVLTEHISDLAQRYSIPWYGENGLALGRGRHVYRYVREILNRTGASGFTLLRMPDIFLPGQVHQPHTYFQNIIMGLKKQIFIVRLPQLLSSMIQAKGFELRIVGNNPALGMNDPAKALTLSQGDETWRGNVNIREPEQVRYRVILYNPKTKETIEEKLSERLLAENGAAEEIWVHFADEIVDKIKDPPPEGEDCSSLITGLPRRP